jgi:TRAP-type mannitol/chloroaromatic compound transport system permease large subunit
MSGEALVGLIMLLVLLGAIFIGVPISFTLLFLAFTFGYFALGATVFDLAYFQTIGLMKEELLAAVPLFIFMGFITEQAGLMERLFTAFRLLLAPVRGALYLVVVLTATVFAMATGIVGAAVTVLGIMASPIMIKSGYDDRLSAGAITAGGTLGILIPPSVMLIVMGPVLGVSVADLYAAAFGPGFLLAGLYLTYLMGRSIINPKLGPPVPKEEREVAFAAMASEVVPVAEFALGLGTLLIPLAYGVYALAAPAAGSVGLALGCAIGLVVVLALFTAVYQQPGHRAVVGRIAQLAGAAGTVVLGGIAIVAQLYPIPEAIALPVLVALIGAFLPAFLAGAFFQSAIFRSVVIGVGPLAALITATLGSILAGLATPTEAAGIGTAGAFLLALIYGGFSIKPSPAAAIAAAITAVAGAVTLVAGLRLAIPGMSIVGVVALVLAGVFLFSRYSWGSLQRALNSTMATSSMVLLLAVTSNIFGAVFARLGTANWITNTLLSFQLPPTLMLLLVLVLIFLLGWPFEWPAIILVFLPIFYPVVAAMKIDLVWFGALVAVTLQTAFLSPPVAMSAYYLKQVVKDWSLANIYRGMFQFMILQCICIGLVLYYPQIALWFPQTLQAAARAQKIPEDHQRIIDQQRKNPQSLEDDDWLKK